MKEFATQNPVIIFGMHRSGTTIVGDLLERHGVFLGALQERNGESLLHQALNNLILRSVGAEWDAPMAMHYLWQEPEIMELNRRYVQEVISSPQRIRYTGILPYLGLSARLTKSYSGWGWKDPRNTFTLPIWESLYPNAKFIYVERHGIDVAKSLVTRNGKELSRQRRLEHKFRTRFGPIKRTGFGVSARCNSMANALSLWGEYVQQGREHVKRLGCERVACIRFEAFCESPKTVIGNALEFLGIGSQQTLLEEAFEQISPGRSLAHQGDPALKEFTNQNARMIEEVLSAPYFE